MNYVQNEEFVLALKEYQELNSDKGKWLEPYKAKLLVKFKNKKITKEKLEIGLEFYEFKKVFFKDKLERMAKEKTPLEMKTQEYRLTMLKESLGKTFLAIANGRMKTPQFVRYPLMVREEMISDATFIMLRYADRFDCRRPNPFSYFTQAAFNAFRAYLNAKKKYAEKYQSINYIENLDMVYNNSDNGLD